MAHIALLKCPFLSRLPKGFAKKASTSLFTYSENCPVMSQILARHASKKQEEEEINQQEHAEPEKGQIDISSFVFSAGQLYEF